MSELILNWVCKCLEEDEDVIVPLRKLWNRGCSQSLDPSFEEFAELVLKDPRVEFMYSIDHNPGLEVFGYFGGPRVKLRSREITVQSVRRIVQKHNERIVQLLARAMELSQEGPGSDTDEDLNEAILMLEGLRPFLKPWTHLRQKDQTT